MPLYRAAIVSVFVAALSVLATVVVWAVTDGGQETRRAGSGAVQGPDHVEVLREWDRRRARAWADGSTGALEALYVPGSRTGARDVRMLRRYAGRGLTVQGMETQLISVRVVRDEPDLLVLDVVDRVVAAEVVGDGVHTRLPTDRASNRQVELRRHDADWLVAEVEDAQPPESP